MIPRILLCLSLLAPVPASALSCLPHDVAATFQRVNDAEEVYVGVLGTLTFDESRLPVVDMEQQQNIPPETKIPARIKGHTLSAEGFVTAFARDVTLNVQCAGPWCAKPQSGTLYLGFLRKENGDYSLSINPCGGDAFADPNRVMRETVRRCFAGGECEPAAEFPQ
ncbi:hypothetical protein D6850_11625 [Roseovarius spongiae]|uniref:Lipoprotein n=1 Tax=Roseovarius spongiae TaxID=2320272 RepID=A0A3A8ARW4_9RHOB|nr:hypothetical protein [Roseovarius spongiae]RKF13842.1 hypothetical protein D6850_11625 [Roseovarius spongiae]